MKSTLNITLSNPAFSELIEAVGIVSDKQLVDFQVELLLADMTKANELLHISEELPSAEEVTSWINQARARFKLDTIEAVAPAEIISEWKNYETDPQVLKHLELAPLAVPLPQPTVPFTQLTSALLLNHFRGKLSYRTEDLAFNHSRKPLPSTSGAIIQQRGIGQQTDQRNSKKSLDPSKIQSFENYSTIPHDQLQASALAAQEARSAEFSLLRTTLEKTNRGVNPNSRRYIRGVLHNRPFQIFFGSLFTFTTALLLPTSLVLMILLVLKQRMPKTFHDVPEWFIIFPALFLLSFIGYLCLGASSKCRVCGQRLYFPKHCFKNSNAHSLPFLGHMIPCAIHTVLFKWFHCTFCGTAIRIKK